MTDITAFPISTTALILGEAGGVATLDGSGKVPTSQLPIQETPIATTTVAGIVIPSTGLSVDGSGNTAVRIGNGLQFDNGVVTVDEAEIDVTKLQNADTLVSGVYQGALDGTSTLVTLTNAQRGNWWNVSAAVTIGGQAFGVGDQLWCKAAVTGVPINLTDFSRVPATMANASPTVAGIVQLAGDLGGTASAPSVLKARGVTLPSVAPTAGQVLQATSTTAAAWATLPAAVAINDQAASGYVDIGNMRIQWGRNTQDTTAERTVTLPVAFANTSYTVTLTSDNGATALAFAPRVGTVGGKTTTNFKARMSLIDGTASGINFSWQAIGLKPA
jgi:hypothetical protein